MADSAGNGAFCFLQRYLCEVEKQRIVTRGQDMTTFMRTLRASADVTDRQRPRPASELVEFAKRRIVHARLREACECRVETREMVVIPVLVQPLDHALQPWGATLEAVTRDLTAEGAGLLYFSPMQCDHLALQMHLDDEVVDIIARVAWRSPLGPFYGTGVHFVERVAGLPRRCRESSGRSIEMRRGSVAPTVTEVRRAIRTIKETKQPGAKMAASTIRMDCRID